MDNIQTYVTGSKKILSNFLAQESFESLPAASRSIKGVGMSFKVVDLDRFPGHVRTEVTDR